MIVGCIGYTLQGQCFEDERWESENTIQYEYNQEEALAEQEDTMTQEEITMETHRDQESMTLEEDSYETLSISEKEVNALGKIMHALGTASVPELLWKQKELKKLGKSINHVHPLKFIGTIISEPILRSDLQETHRNFFKWRAFLDGFRRRMTEEFYKGNINSYIPGFCKSLHVKQEVIEHFVERRDWEGLVKAIMY